MNKSKSLIGLVLSTLIVSILFLLTSYCSAQNDRQSTQKESIVTQGGNKIPGEEKKKEPVDIGAKFYASGWMGDGEFGNEYIQLNESWNKNPHSGAVCIKVKYTPGPKMGWGGIYWQNRPNNWGENPGEDFQKKGYKKLTFWARGELGGEVVEFKGGGIRDQKEPKPFSDSFEAMLGKVTLENTWKQYIIDIDGKDLSCVIGGFCWVASESANPQGLTFYLDDIRYDF